MKKFALALIAVASVTATAAFAAPETFAPRRPTPRPQPRPAPRPQPAPAPRPVPRPMPPPQRDQVVKLGSTRLGPFKDSALIQVNSCAATEAMRIDSIKVRAVAHTATINQIAVLFGNGNTEFINGPIVLREGHESNWVDLRGRGRCVRAIRVFGSATHIIHQAQIDIFGWSRVRSALDLQDRREEQ